MNGRFPHPPRKPQPKAPAFDKQHITITCDEYEALLAANDTLERLQGAGVDNWEGYEYAFREDN